MQSNPLYQSSCTLLKTWMITAKLFIYLFVETYMILRNAPPKKWDKCRPWSLVQVYLEFKVFINKNFEVVMVFQLNQATKSQTGFCINNTS